MLIVPHFALSNSAGINSLKWNESFGDYRTPQYIQKCFAQLLFLFDTHKNKHVWPPYFLALEYLDKNNYHGALELIVKAIENVQKIYSMESFEDRMPFDPDEYINERIKGVFLTIFNYQSLTDELASTQEKIAVFKKLKFEL